MSTTHRRGARHPKIKLATAGAATVAVAAIVLTILNDRENRDIADQRDAAASTTVAPITSAPTNNPETDAALLRAAFLAQAAAARGYETYYGGPQNIEGIASDTCQRINDNPTTTGVWNAAANLEDGPYQMPVAVAWDLVDLSSTTYCPEHRALVIQAIGQAG